MTIHVLIADDHPIVRRGLRQIVSEQSDMAVLGEAANAREVLLSLRESDPDVLLLDLSMPGVDGLELVREVRRLRPKLPVLVLSMYPEDQLGVRVLRTGASGYLTKESAPDELVRAIRQVLAGGKVISSALAGALADTLSDGAAQVPHAVLSDREYEVLCLIGAGVTVSEIAARLELSVKTISTYRTRVLEKMGLSCTAQLMRYALQAGLVAEANALAEG